METAKQPIPNSILKEDLYKIYEPMSVSFIRSEINIIILENRKTIKAFKNKTDNEIICTRIVFKKELLAFADIYGLPEIYLNE